MEEINGVFDILKITTNEASLKELHVLKKSLERKSLISVVTVVLNGEKFLEKTILSVINQAHDNVEYIIIDGGSTDKTLDIIRKYEHAIDYWVSEKDKGIYDAMNKGIELANGDWINFMNAGDVFFSSETLLDLKKDFELDYDFIVGSAIANTGWGAIFLEVRRSSDIWKSFCHQSVFVSKAYAKKNKFDLSFKSASDFDYIYTAFISGAKFFTINRTISVVIYIDSGFSSKYEKISKTDVLKSIFLRGRGYSRFIHFLYHFFKYLKFYIKNNIIIFFPGLLNFLRRKRDEKKIK